jgi:hypothetical protein
MQEIMTYEDALKKASRIEFDEDCYTSKVDSRTEESQRIEQNIEMMKNTIHDLSLRGVDLWCTLCMTQGHKKDTSRHKDDRVQDV